MAEIDNLNIEISAEANEAKASLNSLISTLGKLETKLSAVGSKPLKINLSISGGAEKEIDKLEQYVNKASKEMSKRLQDAFDIPGNKMSGIRSAINEFAEFSKIGDMGGVAGSVENIGDELIKAAASAQEADEQMKDFYETVKSAGKIYINPIDVPTDTWENLDGLLRQKFTTQEGAGATSLDSYMQEWTERFSNLFSGFDTSTVYGQIEALTDVVKKCREEIERPISTQNSDFTDNVWEKVISEVNQVSGDIEETRSAMEKLGGTKVTENTGFKDVANSMKKLTDIDSEKLVNVGNSISQMVTGLQTLNGIKLDLSSFDQISNATKKLKDIPVVNTKNLMDIYNVISSYKNIGSIDESVIDLANALKRLAKATIEMSDGNAGIKAFKDIADSAGSISGGLPTLTPGLEETERKIREISEKFANLGKDFQFNGDTTEVRRELKKYSNSLEKAKLKKDLLESEGKVNTKGYENAVAQVQQLSNVVDVLREKLNEAAMPQVNLDDLVSKATKQAGGEATQTLKEFEEELSEYEKQLTDIENESDEDKKNREGSLYIPTDGLERSLESLKELYPEAEDYIERFEQLIERSRNLEASSSNGNGGIVTPIPDELKTADVLPKSVSGNSGISGILTPIPDELKNISSEIGTMASSSAAELEQVETKTSSISAKMQGLKDKIASAFSNTGLKTYTQEYTDLQSQIDKTEAKIEKLNAQVARGEATNSSFRGTTTYKKMQYDIEGATEKLRQLKEEQASLESSGTATKWDFSGIGSGISSFIGKIKGIGSTMAGVGEKTIPIISSIKTAFSSFKQDPFGTIAKGAGTLLGKITSLIPGINSTNSSMNGLSLTNNRLVKSLSRTAKMFSLMLTRMALRGVINGVQEGFQNLAVYSDEVNSDLSLLVSQLSQLKNAFATAFEPILSVVTPYLSALIDYVIGAVNALAQLFAALTGSSTYTKAVRTNTDYAASLSDTSSAADDVADSTDAATQAAEEYENTVLGFDELNKLNDTTESSSSGSSGSGSGSGGTGTGSSGDLFTTETVSSEIADWASMIAEAWENADFTEIGTILGEKLNNALENIPWDEIKETCDKIAKSVATFLNGFIEATDWELVGETISEGINTAFEAANTFVENFHFGSLGEAIGDCINGAMEELDWDLIQTTCNNTVSGLVQTLNKAIDTTNWDLAGETLAQYANTIIGMFETAVEEFQWHDIGLDLAKGLNSAVESLNLSDFTEAISTGIKGALEAVTLFLDDVNWEAIGKKIGDSLAAVDWLGILTDVGDLIASAIVAACDFATGLVESISEGLKNMSWSDVASTAWSLLQDAWNAYTSLVDLGVDIVVNILEIGADWLTDLINGTVDAILIGVELFQNGWSTVAGWAKTYIGGALSATVNLTGKLVGTAWDTIKTVTTSLTAAAKKKVYTFTAKAAGAWSTLKGYVKNIVNKIKDKTANFTARAKGSWDSLNEKAKSLANNIKSRSATYTAKAVGAWSEIASKAKTLYDSVRSKTATFKAVASGAWSTINSVLNNVKTWLVSKTVTWRISIPKIRLPSISFGTKTQKVLGQTVTLPTMSITWKYYAKGGFPDSADLFWANENGVPEMVGRMGSKTAVANNDQIAAGIAAAVQPAVYNAMMAANNNSKTGKNVELVVELDGKEIGRTAVNYQQLVNKRYSVAPSIV